MAQRSSKFEVRIPKTAEVVARRLRSQIVRGEFATGDALPSESSLVDQFNISRPTLREALRILESERLIEIRRGARGGPRVLGPDREVAATYAGLILQSSGATIEDVLTARTVVEEPAISLMTAAPSSEQVAYLRANVEEYATLMKAARPDADRLTEISEDFHLYVLGLTGNPTLTLFSGMIRNIVHQANRTFAVQQQTDDERRSTDTATSRAHGRLVDLLETGDLAKADKLWRRHLTEVDTVLRIGLPETETVLDLLGE